MLTIKGDFGKIKVANVSEGGSVVGRFLELDLGTSINFFKRLSVVMPKLTENSMGLYSYGSMGRNDKATFASLGVPKHLLRSRGKGCSWDPTGKIKMSTEEITLCPVQYQGEECPNSLWNGCMEQLLGTGNGKHNYTSTPESSALLRQFIAGIYEGLGNSLYELAWFGQHPLIEAANTGDWYKTDDETWNDFYEQQKACGGYLTIVDKLKQEGRANYNVPILEGEYAGAEYRGEIMGPNGLLDRLLKNSNSNMRLASKRGGAGAVSKGIFLVTRSIFSKFEEELHQKYSHLPDMLYYRLNGEFCAKLGCTEGTAPGVLKYNGHLVVCMDEWQMFDDITCTITHRAMLVTPGVFGLAYDVPSLAQFDGLGMRINQENKAPHMGKIYMDTTFKVGMHIIDPDYITMACETLVPETD